MDKGKRDALADEPYYRVRDLAIREAEREAFYAGTPSETKEPVSATSDEDRNSVSGFSRNTGR